MTKKLMKTMDGNEAAAYVSYALTEIATIFPITVFAHAATRRCLGIERQEKHFWTTCTGYEMQAEAGAIGALHGVVEAGSLGTSFTSSQGLMLMIPVLHRLSGCCKPAFFT